MGRVLSFIFFALLTFKASLCLGEGQAPSLKVKFGQFLTTINAGTSITDEELGSLVTVQPTVLWSLPSFRSRMGFHFIADLNSELGLMPISGIGFSGYFYPWGISSSYSTTLDNTVHQKFQDSLYAFASFTPVNLNINQENEINPNSSVSFSAVIIESILGAGYDYPLRANVLLSIEVAYRFGDSIDNTSESQESISYSGLGVILGFTTTYF